MRIYKPFYKSRGGVKCETKKYYLEFRDHLGIVHRLSGFTDKRLTGSMGDNIAKLVSRRITGFEPNADLSQWIESLPDGLLKKFVSWGLIDGQRAEITKPLVKNIADYAEVLGSRGRSMGYVTRCRNRLKKIIRECRFVYFRDITRSRVEIYSGRLKKDGYGDTSRKHYLDAIVSFLNWAQMDGRIVNNPLARMEKPKRDSEKKGVLTPEQFMHLLKTTYQKNIFLCNKRVGRSTGAERAVLYLLAGVTGLRRQELLLLLWGNIHLNETNAFVRVPAKLAKNSKEAQQPIAPATVAILKAYKAEQKPKETGRVFSSLGTWINTAGLLRADLKAAKLPLTDREGNEIFFHSLRNSYISFLANSQTPAKVVQKLARHSDPRLTFNTYARTFEEAEQKAIEELPDMSDLARQFVLARSLALQGEKARTSADNGGHKNGQDTPKNAFLANHKIAPRGFEPLLPG